MLPVDSKRCFYFGYRKQANPFFNHWEKNTKVISTQLSKPDQVVKMFLGDAINLTIYLFFSSNNTKKQLKMKTLSHIG